MKLSLPWMMAGVVLSLAATAAVQGPGVHQELHSVRAASPIQVDGALDEPAWSEAPAFDGFAQRFPSPGSPPSERTEVRVVYTDDMLYVGITAYDSEPDKISRRMARRDAMPMSDAVQVLIDPTHDHRTAYLFYVNAGGVQGDGIIYDDRYFTADWDGHWEGAAGSFPGGWTAEYAIPLSLLRFPEAPVQKWGFAVRRDIARKNEELDSAGNPRSSNATASRMGHLNGMHGLKPRRSVELSPYVAARTTRRPLIADSDGPGSPRIDDPSADVGLDARISLTSDLNLTATLNPDFGQVEADQMILNLSNYEFFFPEKRPYFTQGMELFRPVGSENGQAPHTLFYSRRVGTAETPILGAVKLTGTVAKGVEVGVLDAVVMGAIRPEPVEPDPLPTDEDPWPLPRPDRRFGFHVERPLHLGPNDELPTAVAAPTNFLAAVAKAKVASNSSVGGTFAAASPLTGNECTQAEWDADAETPECLARGGNAGALSFDLKSPDSEYGLLGQVAVSQVVGGPPERTLRDGTVLRRGGVGAGTYVGGGRMGGEGLQFVVVDEFSTPTMDLNATGFQRTQNENHLRGMVGYSRQSGFGPFKTFWAGLNAGTRHSTDGRFVPIGTWVNANANVTLPSFDMVGVEVGGEFAQTSIREIPGTGIPFERDPSAWLATFGNTNSNRPFQVYGFAAVGYHPSDDPDKRIGWGGNLGFNWRPHDALSTSLEVSFDRTVHGKRYVDDRYDALGEVLPGEFLFGDLESNFASTTLRQQWIINPRLTLQAYAQLFTNYGWFDDFAVGRTTGDAPIAHASLEPVTVTDDYDFYGTALNLNVVLRWEYRLGSTIYAVYTRSQDGRAPTGDPTPRTLLPVDLFGGRANDTFLVKWSYYWHA